MALPASFRSGEGAINTPRSNFCDFPERTRYLLMQVPPAGLLPTGAMFQCPSCPLGRNGIETMLEPVYEPVCQHSKQKPPIG